MKQLWVGCVWICPRVVLGSARYGGKRGRATDPAERHEVSLILVRELLLLVRRRARVGCAGLLRDQEGGDGERVVALPSDSGR